LELIIKLLNSSIFLKITPNVSKLGEGGHLHTSEIDKYIEKFRSKNCRSQRLSPRFCYAKCVILWV